MLGAGVLGYLMRKFDYEPAPLVVGLVLGPVMERSFRQALIISQGDASGLWGSPLCLAMWGIALLSVILPMLIPSIRKGFKHLRKAPQPCKHRHD
jgi:putative tricarboxylic transport membrane protein